MGILKPALTLAILMTSMLWSSALAQQPPLPDAAATQQAKPDTPPRKPQPPAPRKTPPRRAVHQIVDGMPPAYGPRLHPPASPTGPAPPAPVTGQPALSPPAIAPPPVAIGRCDTGGCTDVNGTRYNGAAGNTVIGPQGRPCANNGGTVQCF